MLRFAWVPECPKVELVDLISGSRQVFQGPVPDVSKFFGKGKNADIFVVPHDAKFWTSDYLGLIEDYSKKKPVLFFNRGDFPRRISLSNCIALQLVKLHSLKQPTILIPPNVTPLCDMKVREYRHSPTVSFVGYLPDVSISRSFRSIQNNLRHPIMENGAFIRKVGLSRLNGSNLRHISRQRNHYGGALSLIRDPEKFRSEFLQSIEDSDIVFTPRGDANTSQRFFEALSAGRVPVLPDSRVLLPDSFLTLKPTFLKVKTLSGNLEQVVNSFWNNLTKEKWKNIQDTNREVYQNSYDYRIFLEKLFESQSVEKIRDLSI